MRIAGRVGAAIETSVALRLLVASAMTAALFCAHAQVITTVAGTDFTFPLTPLARINAPTGPIADVGVDASGNVYVTDLGNNLVFKVDQLGVLTVVAGNGTLGFSGDGGPSTNAALNNPTGVTVEASGTLFITDALNNRIRKVTPAGIISTVAGNGTVGFSGDGGPATSAALNLGTNGSVAVDAFGNLFIADDVNNRIRKVTPSGIISTVAGDGTVGFFGDGGPATSAALSLISVIGGTNFAGNGGLAADASGNLFIADWNNFRIRKVTPDGIISTVAGNGFPSYFGNGGLATNAGVGLPSGVAVDASGNLFFGDQFQEQIYKVTPAGIISSVAGNGTFGYSGDGGPATAAALDLPLGLAVDASGNLFVADFGNSRVRTVTPSGIINTFLGQGAFRFNGDGGPADTATLYTPTGLAVDAAGNLFIDDQLNNRVRRVTSSGIISTVAGNGIEGYSGDGGPALRAGLTLPLGLAVDTSENLFIADQFNFRVRKVTPAGTISTVAGNGKGGYSGDGGPATSTTLTPAGVAVDLAGNLFIADNNNNRIRKVNPAGIISTVAGTGTGAYFGDGGPATSAALNFPTDVVVDAVGNLFIADLNNNRIRKVTPAGTISTVAGNGTRGYSGDGGPATSAELSLNVSVGLNFVGLAVDPSGNLFFSDEANNRVRKVTPDGIISTVAGNGTAGFAGDGGPAVSAALNSPGYLAVDAAGNLFIADTDNNRVRVVLATAPAASVSPQQLQFTAASGGAPAEGQTLSFISPVAGLPFSTTVPDDAGWLQLNPSSGASPRLIQVTADPTNLAPNTYQTKITINTPYANPTSSTVAVTFKVTAGQPPSLSIDKQSLSFPFPQHGSARSQTIVVSNSGGGTLNFTAMAAANSSDNWLSVSPTTGQVFPRTPVTLAVTADPTQLPPGTYRGSVTVGAQGNTPIVVPVTMTISTLNQAILLSQTGLSFLGVSQGGVLPPQSFRVLNIGSGVVAWEVSKSTLSGGQDWLEVTPTNGVSDATQTAPTVSVGVNASGLAQGAYYGQVRVDAPGAANTPQVLTVFLQVLAAGTNVAAIVQPSELIFTATTGGESPGSQNVEVYNVVAGAKSFLSSVVMDSGLTIATLPQAATLDPQQPTSIVVQPFTSGLASGVYNGTLTLQFSDGNVESVKITVIVSSTGPASSPGNLAQPRSVPDATTGLCTPTKLVPALNTLGQSFAVTAGWPVALGVQVLDDCRKPLNSGSVTVAFSNGDPEIPLLSLNDGTWNGTWQTGTSASAQSQVTLTVTATTPDSRLTGTRALTGGLRSQQVPPIVKGSILSAASAVSFVPLAPGSMISIFGSGLADNQEAASTIPLPTTLGNAQVFMAGQLMPLLYVSDKQINAVVPFGVNTNTQQQVLVLRDLTYSLPVQVNVAPAQPAIFTSAGAGIFIDYRNGPPGFLVTQSAPAKIGDVLVAYCAGLGATSPKVQDGYPSPSSPAAKTPGVTMSIGGQSAPVSFAGLVPGLVGLYQINTQVPAGVEPSNSVTINIAVAGQVSPSVHIAVQ